MNIHFIECLNGQLIGVYVDGLLHYQGPRIDGRALLCLLGIPYTMSVMSEEDITDRCHIFPYEEPQ